MATELQKKTAQAIVNIFETGIALGDYGNVTLLAGDSGHLTYGRSQTTLASGNLFLLIGSYVSAQDAHYADQLKPYLTRLHQIDLSLDHDLTFRDLLEQAGSDQIMHYVQDEFFDRVYWDPAATAAVQLNVTSALGCCVIYDSTVHGSWKMIRDRTNAQFGTPASLTENVWIQRYISVRRDWLANSPNMLLRRTVYRMNELDKLTSVGNWVLGLPIVVRGVTIDESVLAGAPTVRNPMMQGDDVRSVQSALNGAGAALAVDGVYGPTTAAAVLNFQKQKGLTPDGIVGPSTRAALGL
jgi:chitosanase